MEADTLERALHLWQPWHESIRKSREELGYDPNWAVDRAVAWIEVNYEEVICPQAEAELCLMALPPTFQEYWEDCFYCDYMRRDGSVDFTKIRRRIGYEETDRHGIQTGRWVPGNKSLPKLPYEASIAHYPGEELNDSWVRIEVMVHESFASRDLLDEAMDQAWLTLKDLRRWPGSWHPHPLVAYIPHAKANRSEVRRDASERFNRGEVDFEGLLEEQWLSSDNQAALRAIMNRHRADPTRLAKAHLAQQKLIYDRVRQWFPDPKPKVSVKGEWRLRLRLPRED